MKKGYFYIMKLDHDRIKFGFTRDTAGRISTCRTFVPDVQLIGKWKCSDWMEYKAINILGETLVWLGGEVFLCNIPSLMESTNQFFNQKNIDKLRADRNRLKSFPPSFQLPEVTPDYLKEIVRESRLLFRN